MDLKVLTIEGLDLYDQKIKNYVQSDVYDKLNARLSDIEEFFNSINQEGYEILLVKKENTDNNE